MLTSGIKLINFKIKKQMINNFMIKQRKKGPIALFGAGHMAVSFISYFGLKKYFVSIIKLIKIKYSLKIIIHLMQHPHFSLVHFLILQQ